MDEEGMADPPRLIATGATRPAEFVLTQPQSRIGSAFGNDLIIEDNTVSRRHALIARGNGTVELTDTNSSNGTFLNGRRIDGPVTLHEGDEIRFGAARYKVVGIRPSVKQGSGLVTHKQLVVSAPRRSEAGWARRLAAYSGGLIILFALGFGIAHFVNRQHEAPSHEHGASPNPESTAATKPNAAAAQPKQNNPASAGSSSNSPAESAIVDAINRYRASSHLAAVSIDTSLNDGVNKHVNYLLTNYMPQLQKVLNIGAAMHREDPGKPGYTPEGAAAGVQSDINFLIGPPGFRPDSLTWALDDWMAGPFHRLPILNPNLHRIGYGELCRENVCGAVLNVLADASHFSAFPQLYSAPIEFPPDSSTINLKELAGEWPDPLTSCPGYIAPAGLPVTIAIGAETDARLTAFTLARMDGSPQQLDSCGFDDNSYVNPDKMAQQRGRNSLHTFGAVVIVPRLPLKPATYQVTATVNGVPYRWSFAVR
jgi:hypothetical protein